MQGKNRGKTRHPKCIEQRGVALIAGPTECTTGPLSQWIRLAHSAIPGKVGSELSFFPFAEEIEPPVVADLRKCKQVKDLSLQTRDPQDFCLRRLDF